MIRQSVRIYLLHVVVADQGLIGLSLTYAISLSAILLHVVQLSAEVENLVSSLALMSRDNDFNLDDIIRTGYGIQSPGARGLSRD